MPRLVSLTVALLVLAAAGCIRLGPGDDVPAIRFYALDPPSAAATPPAQPVAKGAAGPAVRAAGGLTVSVRPFTFPRRYKERIVRRLAGGRIEFLEFDRWAESPEQGLERVVLAGLTRTGRFRAVVDASVDVDAQRVLDVHIVACEVVGDPGASSARLSLWFLLSDRNEATLLDSNVFSATVPIAGPGLEGLGDAMAQCALDVSAQAAEEWEASGSLR